MAETPSATAPTPKLPTASRDVAWVAVPAPQSPDELAELSRDIEVLLRVNPYYTFADWRQTGPASFHAEFENHSNQQQVKVDLDVSPGSGPGSQIASYRQGLKKRTFFSIEPHEQGSRLLIVDDYESLPESEREARLAEVDKSLPAWGESLRIYFLRLRRWSWVPGWRWYMRQMWMPMKPSSRRIVWMLYLITIVEFLFFLFVLLIYLIEQNKGL
jgi:hypothetical protein